MPEARLTDRPHRRSTLRFYKNFLVPVDGLRRTDLMTAVIDNVHSYMHILERHVVPPLRLEPHPNAIDPKRLSAVVPPRDELAAPEATDAVAKPGNQGSMSLVADGRNASSFFRRVAVIVRVRLGKAIPECATQIPAALPLLGLASGPSIKG